MARDVPVQYFQSIITVLLAVAGALLFQVRFFELTHSERTKEVDPFLRLVMIAVITATLFASLEAMREGWGPPCCGACDYRAGAIAASHPASRPPTADARPDARPQDAAARPTPVGHRSRSDPLLRDRDDHRRVDLTNRHSEPRHASSVLAPRHSRDRK